MLSKLKYYTMDEELKQQVIEWLKKSLKVQLTYTDTYPVGKDLKITISIDDEVITSHKESLYGIENK